MIILDPTVLVYAVGEAHRFRDPCQRMIVAIRDGHVMATTTPQVVQEFAHVRARRRGRADARRLGIEYTDLLSPLLAVDEDGLRAGLDLFGAAGRPGAFDSLVAAAGLANHATVVSADVAFGDIPGLRHVVPDEAGVAKLLAG